MRGPEASERLLGWSVDTSSRLAYRTASRTCSGPLGQARRRDSRGLSPARVRRSAYRTRRGGAPAACASRGSIHSRSVGNLHAPTLAAAPECRAVDRVAARRVHDGVAGRCARAGRRDPASDVLAEQGVFIPADGSIPAREQAQLEAIVRVAQRSGHPVRVAVIASRSDLGSITGLWRAPAAYAGFLGRELSLVYHGALLVVMPNGYGVDLIGEPGASRALQSAGASLEGLRLPGRGAALAQAAVSGIRRIAASAGHRLAAPTATSLPRATSSSGSDTVAWIVLLVGAALVAAAWTASLRVRPWPRGDRAHFHGG